MALNERCINITNESKKIYRKLAISLISAKERKIKSMPKLQVHIKRLVKLDSHIIEMGK